MVAVVASTVVVVVAVVMVVVVAVVVVVVGVGTHGERVISRVKKIWSRELLTADENGAVGPRGRRGSGGRRHGRRARR
jgi:hypothetical protein